MIATLTADSVIEVADKARIAAARAGLQSAMASSFNGGQGDLDWTMGRELKANVGDRPHCR